MQAIDIPPPKECRELRHALEEEQLHQARQRGASARDCSGR